ncbi:MAG: hypothetical protein ACYDHX_02595 [Methanothrix sp.]
MMTRSMNSWKRQKPKPPKAAEVADVAFEDYQDLVEGLSEFSFRFQSLQVSKGIESILRIEKLHALSMKNHLLISELKNTGERNAVDLCN